MTHLNLISAILLLALPCLALQCDNEKDKPKDNNKQEEATLPPATQTGEGTFGCKVNGEVWRPEAPPNINELHADYYQDEFFVGADKRKDPKSNYTSMVIRVEDGFNEKGKYRLNGDLGNNYDMYASYSNVAGNCKYKTDSINTGKLTITHFDSAKRIVAGRFHFTAVIKQGKCEKDTIRVTEGRFDIQD